MDQELANAAAYAPGRPVFELPKISWGG